MKKRILFVLSCAAGMLMACGGNNPQPATTTGDQTTGGQATTSKQDYSSVEAISVSEYKPDIPVESGSEELINDEAYEYDSVKVNPVTNLVNDFAFGADLSAVAEVEAHGGVYYDKDGKPGDVFKILADNGVNYCRLRLWNDPYSDTVKDADGNRLPYGGGSNDLATDIYLAKRAKAAGMKVLLDFHYSDHWADPSKFFVPKEWQDEFLSDMPSLLGEYTAGTLKAFKNAGVTIDSVQIGNEENTGLAGFRFNEAPTGIAAMVKAGVDASRSVFPEIKTMIHLTNIKTKKSCQNFLAAMAEANVDYDIVGLSYYPFWHGEQNNLTWMMEYIKDTYNKPSWVVETSYGFTDEATEWASNQYGSHLENAGGYLTSWQGQTTAIRDIVQTIANAKDHCGQGCFYWEPAWLPVRGSTWATPVGQYYNAHGRDPYNFKASTAYKKGNVVAYNGEIYTAKEDVAAGEWDASKWEVTYSEFSCRSAWANQGWFSFTGKALPSISTYKLLQDGSKAATEHILGIRENEIEVTVNLREGVKLPSTALTYSDFDALRTAPVAWSQTDLDAIVDDGTFTVNGTVSSGSDTYNIVANVIAQTNWVDDFSFENQPEGEQVAVSAPWEATSNVPGGARIEAKSEGNLDGSKYFHWYSTSENTWELSQTITVTAAGSFDLATRIMAGAMKSDYKVFDIWYELNGGERVSKSILDSVKGYGSPLAKYMVRVAIDGIELTGTSNTLKIGLYCEQQGDAWGHCDVWSFSKHQEQAPVDENEGFELTNSIGATIGWTYDENSGAMNVVDNSGGDAVGSPSTCATEIHFWSDAAYNFAMHKQLKALEAGNYTFSFLINADKPENFDKFEFYYFVDNSNETIVDLKAKMNPNGWASTATLVSVDGINLAKAGDLTIGIRVNGKAGSWGHFTDLLLAK